MNKTIFESAVFLNDKKTENAPDYTKTVETLTGKLYVAIWKTTSKEGKEYLNLKISSYDNQQK